MPFSFGKPTYKNKKKTPQKTEHNINQAYSIFRNLRLTKNLNTYKNSFVELKHWFHLKHNPKTDGTDLSNIHKSVRF